MRFVGCWVIRVLFFVFCFSEARGGGSGLNVVVVVNQNSSNSIELGNYYAERRQVPPQNILRIDWPSAANVEWIESDVTTFLYNPLVSMLASRQLTNQIEYVVLSMDIPYRVNSGSSKPNSTTSALFYGFKHDNDSDLCSIGPTSTNLYAGTEAIFRLTPPTSANSNSWLVTMITHSNLALAKQIVDSGAAADGTFPTQTVYLAKSIDTARNVRHLTFDNTIFNTRLRGNYSMQRTNSSLNWVFGHCLGLQQGLIFSTVPDTTFAPGAMADNLTSYGGAFFDDTSGQFKFLAYLTAGAAGGYGTVTEPCNYLEKFPSPQNYFYQARGFSLAECYYQSLTNPYQGVIVGEPLAAPFAQPPNGTWSGLPNNAVLAGTTNLTVQFTASAANRPVQQVDLFLDGLWLQTLTNIPPAGTNLLTVIINGHPVPYLVPLNATIKSVTRGLAAAVNNVSTVTKVNAFPHGDRIELQSTDRSKAGSQVSLSTSSSIGTAAKATTWINSSGSSFLDTVALGIRNFRIAGNPVLGSFLVATITKTNTTQFSFGVTNTSGALTLAQMADQLLNQINNSPNLSGSDGLSGQDLITDAISPVQMTEVNFLARGMGWDAAQIQASISGSFISSPIGTVRLDENLQDLEPRAHLYITSGVTNLPLTFALNTSSLSDGYHQLTAVAYEGSHVRTQKRLDRGIVIQNSTLAATFQSLVGETNAAVESALQFSIVANTGAISRIDLFSTGGSQAFVTGQSSAILSVPATKLGIGLHPFYGIITANNGKQYRTETKWLCIVGHEPPLSISIGSSPTVLTWPATPGRTYEVLTASNLTDAFQVQASIVPTNSLGRWTDSNITRLQRFYRVRTSN
jgi:uncharacterized protein (TIGR03790 family)